MSLGVKSCIDTFYESVWRMSPFLTWYFKHLFHENERKREIRTGIKNYKLENQDKFL